MVEGEALGTLGSFEDEEMGEGGGKGGKLTEEVGRGGVAGHFFSSSFFLTSKIRNNEED